VDRIAIRQARRSDAETIATIFAKARGASMPYLPELHSAAEDIAYFRDVVLATEVVCVAERNEIVGFCAIRDHWLNHLYVDPDHQRTGIGTALLAVAAKQSPVLNLWVFQRNTNAIRFYKKHGFVLVKQTDGKENEEKEPDALYRRAPSA